MEKVKDIKDMKDAGEEGKDSLSSASSTVANISRENKQWHNIRARTDIFKTFTTRLPLGKKCTFRPRLISLDEINQNSFDRVNFRRCNKEKIERDNRNRSTLLSASNGIGTGASTVFSHGYLSGLVCANVPKLNVDEMLRPPAIGRGLYWVSSELERSSQRCTYTKELRRLNKDGYSVNWERAPRRGKPEKRFVELEQRKEIIQGLNESMLKFEISENFNSSPKNMEKPLPELRRGLYLFSKEHERNSQRYSYIKEVQTPKKDRFLTKYERASGRGESENGFLSNNMEQLPAGTEKGLYLVSNVLVSNSQQCIYVKGALRLKKNGFLAKYERALRRGQQEKSFVEFEQRKGITQGLSGSILRREYSYGVDLVEVQLEDSSKSCFLLDRTKLMEEGTNIVTVADYFRSYKYNNTIVFIQPFNLIEL